MRFLLDEDVPPAVARSLREHGQDAVSIYDLRRQGLSDEVQLAYATVEGRVFVTYNRADFQAPDHLYRERGDTHPGILWVTERTIPRRAIGTLSRALLAVTEVYSDLSTLCLPLLPPPD